MTSGQTFYFDGAMVTETSDAVGYIDGDSADSGYLDYAWTGTPHASSSVIRNIQHRQERLAAILTDNNEPQKLVTSLRWNAQQDPVRAAKLELQDRITVTRRGISGVYRVIGIKHDLTGSRWMQELTLSKESA